MIYLNTIRVSGFRLITNKIQKLLIVDYLRMMEINEHVIFFKLPTLFKVSI